MDNNQLKRLERNLTKSAKRAKQFWVRGMVGYTESDQGFFPIELIPVLNTIQGKNTTLAELIEDIGSLNIQHKELKLANEGLTKELETYKLEQEQLQLQNKLELDALALRVAAIEAFKID